MRPKGKRSCANENDIWTSTKRAWRSTVVQSLKRESGQKPSRCGQSRCGTEILSPLSPSHTGSSAAYLFSLAVVSGEGLLFLPLLPSGIAVLSVRWPTPGSPAGVMCSTFRSVGPPAACGAPRSVRTGRLSFSQSNAPASPWGENGADDLRFLPPNFAYNVEIWAFKCCALLHSLYQLNISTTSSTLQLQYLYITLDC